MIYNGYYPKVLSKLNANGILSDDLQWILSGSNQIRFIIFSEYYQVLFHYFAGCYPKLLVNV